MSYIVQSNIEDVFGVANVAKWSQLDPDSTTADTDRISSAIAWAEDWIDSRLRDSRYEVPIQGSSGTPSLIVDVAAKLAGHWLYRSRGFRDDDQTGDKIAEHREDADDTIDKILSGRLVLDAARSETAGSAPEVVL